MIMHYTLEENLKRGVAPTLDQVDALIEEHEIAIQDAQGEVETALEDLEMAKARVAELDTLIEGLGCDITAFIEARAGTDDLELIMTIDGLLAAIHNRDL